VKVVFCTISIFDKNNFKVGVRARIWGTALTGGLTESLS